MNVIATHYTFNCASRLAARAISQKVMDVPADRGCLRDEKNFIRAGRAARVVCAHPP